MRSDSFFDIVLDALEALEHEKSRRAWHVEGPEATGGGWIHVSPARLLEAEQGWKLHLSATAWSAEEVLRRALPVLLAERAAFKVAPSSRAVESLNEGEGGLSQIGKFMTVYPRDDEQAVRIAVALDRATEGLRGPRVPSDRPLRPGSLVHYRFGSFVDRVTQAPTGELVSMLTTPTGELEPERRGSRYAVPDWAVDPFAGAGSSDERTPLAGRYVPVVTLHRSPRGTVQLAADLEAGRPCVLKQAFRDARVTADGVDARDHLRREAELLQRFGPDPSLPAVIEVLEHEGDLYLAMERLEGETLSRHVSGSARTGRLPPEERVIEWGRALARTIGRIHGAGFVYRDLTSLNVIVGPDGELALVDLELVREAGSAPSPFGAGTHGYCSPQQARGESPAVSDDVYSLGAVLYFALTGAEPADAPEPEHLLSRPIRALRPGASRALAGAVERCLRLEPGERFASTGEVDRALAKASGPRPPAGADRAAASERNTSAYGDMAREIGDRLCRAFTSGDGRADGGPQPLPSRDLAGGMAGMVLALAELVDEFRDPGHGATLAAAARQLAEWPALGHEPLPGLYVGEAGIAAAILRAGQALDDRPLLGEAVRRGAWVSSLPTGSPDLFAGTAGRLRFHLLLWDETRESEHLEAAVRAGEALVAAAEDTGGGAVRWRIPAGWGRFSDRAYLGYAHGAAGIADTLLDLLEATGEARYLDRVRGAVALLERHQIAALDDGGGLTWPDEEDGAPAGALWCHGSTGIGRFLLRAADSGGMQETLPAARRAALMVSRGARFLGPLSCHGLAGNIEFLLDMARTTGEEQWRWEALSLAELLRAFVVEADGGSQWFSGSHAPLGPDYLGGYGGIGMCLLRLADPERPSQLTRDGFRFSRRSVHARGAQ